MAGRHMSTLFGIAVLFLASTVGASQASAQSGAGTEDAGSVYLVHVPDARPGFVEVEADIQLYSKKVGMLISQSSLANGQADLVRDLKVLNAAGLPIDMTGPKDGDWTLVGVEPGQRVTVRYRVLLEHEQHGWPAGIDEVAYVREDGLFFTGFSLFIVAGQYGSAPAEVTFDLPDGWKASTPWARAPVAGNTFIAASTTKLLNNCVFLGTHREERVTLGDFTFVMALGGRFKESATLFVDSMRPVLSSYVDMFGGLPNDTHYLAVVHEDAKSDGGAFPGSYSMLLAGEVNEASRLIWGHGMAHELLHFWNGHTIRPQGQEEWFKEGFTDYLTTITMHRTRLTDDVQMYKKLENFARRYTLGRRMGGGSIRAAGASKHDQYFLVYGGGALVAFALDVRLRDLTDNARGLPDLMRAMYAEFGGGDKGYTLDDVVRIASAIAGKDQTAWFASHIEGDDLLPIAAVFNTIGLQFDTVMDECYVSARANATARQRAMQQAMFGP